MAVYICVGPVWICKALHALLEMFSRYDEARKYLANIIELCPGTNVSGGRILVNLSSASESEWKKQDIQNALG